MDQDHDEQLWAADFVEESFAVIVLLSRTMRVRRSERIEYFVVCRSLLTRSLCAPPHLQHKFPYEH